MSEAKYRITDLAKEFKTDKGTIIDILKSKNYKVKNMFSAVGEEERAAVKAELGRTAKPVRKEALPSKAAAKAAAPKTTAPKKPVEKADDAEKPAEQPEVKAPSAYEGARHRHRSAGTCQDCGRDAAASEQCRGSRQLCEPQLPSGRAPRWGTPGGSTGNACDAADGGTR